MENHLQTMSLNDMMTMAKTFAESGMFQDTKQLAQAFVKIQAGQELGIAPFAAMSGIHIIAGKPTIGAGLMAAKVKGSGKYDYEVKQQDDKACSLDFFQGKKFLGNSTFTIEEARKAGTKNLDKFPKNMLFARAMSNGVKWFTPDIFTGAVYVDEEMETVDVPHTEIKEEVKQIKQIEPAMTIATDKAIAKAIDRIQKGEEGILENMRKNFTLTLEQDTDLALAEQAYKDEVAIPNVKQSA